MSLPAEYYFKNTTDGTLILDPRAALLYPFDAGTWTDLRVGIALSVTNDSADNGTPVAESRNVSSYSDWIAIGFKNASNQDLPGQGSGSRFFGLLHGGTTAALGDIGAFFLSLASGAWDGTTTVKTNLPGNPGQGRWTPSNLTGDTNYSIPLLIKFELVDRGLASQKIKIGYSYSGTHAVSVGGLRSQLATFSPQNGTINTHDYAGSVPNAFFFRWPWLQNRARLHCLVIEKFS